MTPSFDLRSLPASFPLPAAFQMPASFPMPAASAVTDIVVAACQRSMSLHAQLVDQLVGVGLEQSRHALSDPRGALRDAMLATSSMEPVWRYAMGMAGIGQSAATSVATLLTAQMRGAEAEVASLSRIARNDAARCTADAAGAAQTAMSRGMAALGRLAETATVSVTDVVTRSATDGLTRAVSQVADAADAAEAVARDAGRTPGSGTAGGAARAGQARRAAPKPAPAAGTGRTGRARPQAAGTRSKTARVGMARASKRTGR
ncbi:MAG: hypothetical protein EHM87_14400 [Burkholderiales bacterium]|nr:MAG: hypothetical protein EHM87_14400 [Burkholderiales bacterium]